MFVVVVGNTRRNNRVEEPRDGVGYLLSPEKNRIRPSCRVVSCRVPSASARSHPGRTEPSAVILESFGTSLEKLVFVPIFCKI